MAIVRVGEGGSGAAKRSGMPIKQAVRKLAKRAAKKGVLEKHAAKKHAGKEAAKKVAKKAAKKGANKQAPPAPDAAAHISETDLGQAFHHLQRAAAIISLLEADSGSDLRSLLENGVELYRRASGTQDELRLVRCATGLLRAAEHLGMAGLYSARGEFRVAVEPPSPKEIERHLHSVQKRLQEFAEPSRAAVQRLLGIARELLRRAAETDDSHLRFELTMAADGLCTALEVGF